MSGGGIRPAESFSDAARKTLRDRTLRANLGFATRTICEKRERVTGEIANWQDTRTAGASLKDEALANLEENLLLLEQKVKEAGGTVHWACTAEEAVEIVSAVAKSHQTTEIVKVKSITSDEIELNRGLVAHGIQAVESDLAELICQLADDSPSHILVPAIHKNRDEIRSLFEQKLGATLDSSDPAKLAEVARLHLREKFLTAKMAVSGANFAIAETGSIGVVESEGNGRMCLTLPPVLVTIMGIEKVLPKWSDLATLMRLLPRASTAERMNPYTSIWTGVTPGDGPQDFHLILLDNGRTNVLADAVGRQTLRCIRCSACLNVCPVYQRVGGHAYGSVYPGPIGAILTPQLLGMKDENANTLPFASSMCGACYEACPVKINIPEVLAYLRGKTSKGTVESSAFHAAFWVMAHHRRFSAALKGRRLGASIAAGLGLVKGWTESRGMPEVPKESFREWWGKRG